MMKRTEKLALASVVLLTIAFFSSTVSAQQTQGRGGIPLQLLASDEKLVKLPYMKIMLYSRAANAQRAAERKISHNADDDIRFVIENIHTGPIEEILDQPYGQFVTSPTGNILQVVPGTISHNNGPKHAEYNIRWIDAATLYSTANSDDITVREALSRHPKFADVGKYSSYEVTVRLSGQERSYRALFLYHGPLQSAVVSDIEIQDNVVGSHNLAKALAEELPPVRSPWRSYVNSAAHRAISTTTISGKGNYNENEFATDGAQERNPQPSSGSLTGEVKSQLSEGQRDQVHLAYGRCSVGEFVDDRTSMCCEYGTMQCCFPYDPNGGWCDDATCGYPDCNPEPTPVPAPNTCSCTEGTEYFNAKQSGFEDFSKHFPNGTRHSGWMQTQGHCETLCSCAINCAVDPWGDPAQGVWDDGRKTTWDGLRHVPITQTSRQTASANKGGTANCGFAFGVGWVACADATCSANVTISWGGVSFSINSSGFYTGALQDTLTCKSP